MATKTQKGRCLPHREGSRGSPTSISTGRTTKSNLLCVAIVVYLSSSQVFLALCSPISTLAGRRPLMLFMRGSAKIEVKMSARVSALVNLFVSGAEMRARGGGPTSLQRHPIVLLIFF